MQAKKFKVHRLKRNEIGQGQWQSASAETKGMPPPPPPISQPSPFARKTPSFTFWKEESKLNAIKLNAAQRLPDDVLEGKVRGKSGKLRQSESLVYTCGEFLSNLHNNYRASVARAKENWGKTVGNRGKTKPNRASACNYRTKLWAQLETELCLWLWPSHKLKLNIQ